MIAARLKSAAAAIAAGSAVLVAGCGERPPMATAQIGYRGTGSQTIVNPRLAAKLRPANVIPPTPYALEPDTGGERASQAYQNVQVLGDLSTDSFNHLMASITQWVAPPEQGCNYCHNPENMASDAVYTKVVARRMIQMTRNINVNWTSHVQQTGVTCYTCHRGNAVPKYVWNEDPAIKNAGMLRGNSRGQNRGGEASVRFASLPYDPFTPYLLKAYPIRVQSTVAVNGPETPIKATEATYGLMMHMSGSLGVNCSYCHNSRAWSDWSQSRPQRVTAWYGIRMVRDINNDYIQKLAYAMPANRKGPLGDPYKANCSTCHQGVAKPLYGVSMRGEHPQLWTGAGATATFLSAIPAGVTPLAADPTATAASCNAEFKTLLTGAEVEFDTGSARLSTAGQALLDRLATLAGRCSAHKVTIEGHTDVTGAQVTNLPLSRDRAGAVASFLVGKGVRPGQIAAIGYGESRPKIAGQTPEANQANRRIELTVTG